jgi:hypothetical protein
MLSNYRTIKPFPLTLEASLEADWAWEQTAGEHLGLMNVRKERLQ